MWQWQFRHGKPSIGCLTIKETADRQDSASKALNTCQKETSEGSKGNGA